MRMGDIEVLIPGISGMHFGWRADGYGELCNRCKKEIANNELSGDMPPNLVGRYCSTCQKEVCKELSGYLQQRIAEIESHGHVGQ